MRTPALPEQKVRDVCSELNQLFWKHQTEVVDQKVSAEAMVLIAAKQALNESGALEGLVSETRDFILREDESVEAVPAPTGWARLTGALSGLNSFFSNQMSGETEIKMARLVYLCILKQRWAVVGAQNEI